MNVPSQLPQDFFDGKISETDLIVKLGELGLCDPLGGGAYIESEHGQWLHVFFEDGSILQINVDGSACWV